MMTTFKITYVAESEIEEITLTDIEDMRVMVGDIVVFLNNDGDAVFGIHSTRLISFQRELEG